MLQQTQVERVVPYFTRWMQRFPDPLALADADENEILRYWEGLGYYMRARNLLKTARILAENDGILPQDYKALLALPGIGPYTAGAIMSIAFNRDYPVVDANVERVFSRLFDISSPIQEKKNKKFIFLKAAEMLPSGQSRFFNQALMELGALICLPQNPSCTICPVNLFCKSLQENTVPDRPVLVPRKQTIHIKMATGILMWNSKILIQKRLTDDVWANLWEFPGGRLKEGESPEQALIREFFEETDLRISVKQKITTVKHSYMHYQVTLHGFFCQINEGGKIKASLHAAQENRWVTFTDLQEYAFPAGHRKLINYLLEKIDLCKIDC